MKMYRKTNGKQQNTAWDSMKQRKEREKAEESMRRKLHEEYR